MNPSPPRPAGKLKLGENHRRALSVVLRGLEQMGMEIEAWLERKSRVLIRVQDDLNADQKTKLRRGIEQLRREIERLATEIELDPEARSPARAIRGTAFRTSG